MIVLGPKKLGLMTWLFLHSNGERSWNLQFRRAPHDWELEAVDSLFELLYFCMSRGEGRISCLGSWLRMVCLMCAPFLFGDSIVVFPWKSIWFVKVLKRVSFSLWTTARDGILTIDNLVKRGQSHVDWCCMCWCDGESVDHLLLLRKLAYALQCDVFHVFGVHLVMLKMVNSLLFA